MDAPTSPSDASGPHEAVAGKWSLYGALRWMGLVRLIGASRSGTPAMPERTRTEIALLFTEQRSIDAEAA